jgi:N-methylhydantoinase B
MELNTEPGGEGKFRGGRGIVMDYRVRADNGFLTVGYTRSKFPPWSLDGGVEGTPNYVRYMGKDGTDQRYAFVSGLTTHTDDVIRVVTGNGGGIGDPKERDRKLVGRRSEERPDHAERAREVYGYET